MRQSVPTASTAFFTTTFVVTFLASPSAAEAIRPAWSTSAPAEPAPASRPDGGATPSPWTPALEAALGRALATGCRDGFDELQGVAAAGGSAGEIAGEVVRLCQEIRRKDGARLPHSGTQSPAGEAVVPAAAESRASFPTVDRRGRSRLVPALTLFGVWGGVAFDVLAEVDGDRAQVFFPMLGMTAGLVGSILATRTGEISNGQAWSIITGLEYGTVSGMLWSATADDAGEKEVIGTGLVTGIIGGGLGLWVARYQPPAGAVEMVRSGGIWGTATALMLALMSPSASGPSDQVILTSLAIGLDAGMVGGALLASRVPISTSRMLLIDAGALAGLGFGLGGTWLAAGSEGHRQLIGAGGLVGLAVGLGVAVVLTGDMDADGESHARAFAPALIVRDERGQLGLGALVLSPVIGPPGSHLPISGLSAALFGGAF